MAHALFWPPTSSFQPLGDTPAVSLTQNHAPEKSVNVLLLGCGDPRHILFTLLADVVSSGPRRIDISCCDIEPAILARNILLFTLLDDKEDLDRVWDIFYHFKINDHSSSILTRQSQRLYDYADTIEAWYHSPYGSFLKLLDTRTLVELRRHWKSYADFSTVSPERIDKLVEEQLRRSKSVLTKHESNILPSRAAGPFCLEAATPVSNLFRRHWETGAILAQDDTTNLNPTFVYSVLGETFNLEHTTFPQGFHLAPAITPIHPSSSQLKTEDAIISIMKSQFAGWAEAFCASRATESIILRFYAGDALAFCRTLDLFSRSGKTVPGLYVSEWCASQVNLDAIESSTPTSFDVIETSNLADHLDFYNLIIASRSLMKPHAVLYTESLLLTKRQNIERSVMDNRLHTSVPMLALLIGLAPRHYISGFSSHSPNAHEDHLGQVQERIAWIDPTSGDPHAVLQPPMTEFDPEDLATALFGLYDKMFYREQIVIAVFEAKLSYAMPLHYTRESIGALFRVVQSRVKSDWPEVGRIFIDLVDKARNYVVGSQYVHDTKFWLHLAGVYTDPSLLGSPSPSRLTAFRSSNAVPAVVCVVITVPRKHLKALLENKDTSGIPQLEVAVKSMSQGGRKHGYGSVHCVWGKLLTASAFSGSEEDVTLEEDLSGFTGSSDLVVSFWASSRILAEPNMTIAFALKTSSHSEGVFKDKTASGLVLFAAELNDRMFVKVLRYRPSSKGRVELVVPPPVKMEKRGGGVKVTLALGTNSIERIVVSFTARVELESEDEKQVLLDGMEVNAEQISSCTARLTVGEHLHTIVYPYPILGEKIRLRVARKSGWVEVIVPPSESVDSGGYQINPTPVIQNNSWNIHHISLDHIPQLDISDPAKLEWTKVHVGLQLSDRERDLILDKNTAKSPFVTAWADARDTIATIIKRCSGIDSPQSRVVSLCESKDGETYAMLLIGGFRLDLASNTIICDAAVVQPVTESLSDTLRQLPIDEERPNLQLITSRDEVVAWKKIIPAFVERCRTWSHGPNCEYAREGSVPISTEPGDSPICTCGQGVGFDNPEWKINAWADLLSFATRLAISPLFHSDYPSTPKNTISDRVGETEPRWEFRPRTPNACWMCSGAGKPTLMTCSRCEKARYCSASCQKQDWKTHKKTCNI